jgi:hypothetical protein
MKNNILIIIFLICNTITSTQVDKNIKMTGNGFAGFIVIFFTFFWIYFMISLTRGIFISTQWVKEPLFIGKCDG